MGTMKELSERERKKALASYERRIVIPPQEGSRHTWIYSTACLAKRAGLEPEKALADLQAIATLQGGKEQSDISKAVAKVYSDPSIETKPRKKSYNVVNTETVFARMVKLGMMHAETYPPDYWLEDEGDDWRLFLRTIYKPETLILGSYGEPHDKGSRRVMAAKDWQDQPAPRYIVASPHSGQKALTTDGDLSDAAKGCFPAHAVLLVEMDAYPDGWRKSGKVERLDQAGLLCFLDKWGRRKEKLELLAITHSGGKSHHGLFRYYGAPEGIPGLYDELEACGVDGACRNVNRWTRAPGGSREDGSFQRLDFINRNNINLI